MGNPVIRVENLSKQYVIGEHLRARETLRETLMRMLVAPFQSKPDTEIQSEPRTIWSLRDVSFEVEHGEVLGVIGPNGAGKSTLLKVLSRITEPTQGQIELRGRISSLLEVGTGFHTELTGRENIFLNGAILGMSRTEIRDKFDQIVDFSEVGSLLDTPVKRYSSGMYVRLAFAVAAHLEPDILIIDEVLSVGDAAFRKKCLGKMEEVAKSGRTVLYVSHNMASVKDLCHQALYLEKGRIVAAGKVEQVISRYLAGINSDAKANVVYPSVPGIGQVVSASLLAGNTRAVGSYEYDEPVAAEIELDIREAASVYLGMEIVNDYGQNIIFWRDFELQPELMARRQGHFRYRIKIPANVLAPGTYRINLALVDFIGKETLHRPKQALIFNILDNGSVRQRNGFPWNGLTSVPLQLDVSTVSK